MPAASWAPGVASGFTLVPPPQRATPLLWVAGGRVRWWGRSWAAMLTSGNEAPPTARFQFPLVASIMQMPPCAHATPTGLHLHPKVHRPQGQPGIRTAAALKFPGANLEQNSPFRRARMNINQRIVEGSGVKPKGLPNCRKGRPAEAGRPARWSPPALPDSLGPPSQPRTESRCPWGLTDVWFTLQACASNRGVQSLYLHFV